MAEKLDPRQELATFDELLRGMTRGQVLTINIISLIVAPCHAPCALNMRVPGTMF